MTPTATYRVLLRERPRFAEARGEWRLLLRSLRDDVVGTRNYSAFIDAYSRPDLDARCLSLTLAYEPGLTLLIETGRAVRRFGEGTEARLAQYVNAMLVLPVNCEHLSDDDIFAVWAEWRSQLTKTPDITAKEAAEAIEDLLNGIIEVDAESVESLINHNHAPCL